MIDVKNVFDQPITYQFKTHENIRKVKTGKGDDCTSSCSLDYPCFKENCKKISIDLENSSHQMLIIEQFNRLILLQIFERKQSRKYNNVFHY